VIDDRWSGGGGPPPEADALDQLVYLSALIGREPRLVQPGGGNTSTKTGDLLLVKGSGTDLETIGRAGFTRLSLRALAGLRSIDSMGDADMMRFMAGAMTDGAGGGGGPMPSVETPLHALLPAPVIAHTHDVATMSLTNVSDETARRLLDELFQGDVVYAPYTRPGFPLAQAIGKLVAGLPANAIGLALAHHGMVVWGDDARTCYRRLVQVINRIEDYLETRRRGREPFGARSPLPAAAARQRAAQVVLPVVRGVLGIARRVILHFDDAPDILADLSSARLPELVARGVATPEHILRAGPWPRWLSLDLAAAPDRLAADIRDQLTRQRAEYEAYHGRHAAAGVAPLEDWAKVVLVPGLGMITAGADKRGAVTANACYRAVLQSIANAEAIEAFRFLPEPDVFEFEHWPLERRKLDEQAAQERATRLVPRQVVVVIGGGSGIGQAAAKRFVEEGAHVVVADLDAAAATTVASEITKRHAGRAVAVAVDVTDDASLERLFERSVLEFGGVDCLFYTAGAAPRFAGIADIRRADLQRQLDVHYLGAVLAIGRVAAIMRRQGGGLGGAIVASVSKAALAAGKEAVAYGGSKAALMQALRVAAVELGGDGIRVNAINADQVDTPLFRAFVAERARQRGVTVEAQLEAYRVRNVLGVSLIPPEAAADLAVLLASERFRYTTGDILTLDGGLPDAFPR
jgi:rhamnose utilization protein RhaD (predicted bifunctional aldolase and dehydrogenase)/NAD(P)-dependent dehydrogenase (short-subunit alcohol dehydrogenase family)